jgi:vacuolar-type H+-ATPase subunit E/Vma4
MQEQEEKLQQEILQDARRKAERVVERAQKEAERLVQVVRRDQAKAAEALLASAAQDAHARARAILAGIRHDIQKQWLRCRESVLDRVLTDGLQRVEQGEGFDRRRSLLERLVEGIAAVGSEAVATIIVAAQDAPLLDSALLAAAAQQVNAAADAATRWRVTVDPELVAGFVVVSTDGRRRFDQTFTARLARLKRALRQVVAERVGAGALDVAAITKECQSHE